MSRSLVVPRNAGTGGTSATGRSACLRWVRVAPLALVLAVMFLPRAAHAHGGELHHPSDFWRWWTLDWYIVVPLTLASLGYAIGARRVRRRSRHARALSSVAVASYVAGMAVLIVALVSPLDTLGAHLFSAHMLQHVLLMLVAAPLLVLGRPAVAMAWSLPPHLRRRVARVITRPPVRRAWSAISNPYVVWLVHAAAVWMWHAPPLYEATLYSAWIHALQHISFFGTALLFWWAVLDFGRRRSRAGAGVLYIFTTAVHGSILGALLTFSTAIWYPSYGVTATAWGIAPLDDQQLGGLVMWIPSGMIYLLAALASLATLLATSPAERMGVVRSGAGRVG